MFLFVPLDGGPVHLLFLWTRQENTCTILFEVWSDF